MSNTSVHVWITLNSNIPLTVYQVVKKLCIVYAESVHYSRVYTVHNIYFMFWTVVHNCTVQLYGWNIDFRCE